MSFLRVFHEFNVQEFSREILQNDHSVFLFPQREQTSSSCLKQILSQLTETRVGDIEFTKNENGKPSWKQSSWQFNASHSHQMMILGFSRNAAIGVDLEKERELRLSHKFPERIMTETEQRDFLKLPKEQHLSRLIQSWSLKEAILKCHGGSFFRDAHHIDLGYEPLRIRALPAHYEPLAKWNVQQTDFTTTDGSRFYISLALVNS